MLNDSVDVGTAPLDSTRSAEDVVEQRPLLWAFRNAGWDSPNSRPSTAPLLIYLGVSALLIAAWSVPWPAAVLTAVFLFLLQCSLWIFQRRRWNGEWRWATAKEMNRAAVAVGVVVGVGFAILGVLGAGWALGVGIGAMVGLVATLYLWFLGPFFINLHVLWDDRRRRAESPD